MLENEMAVNAENLKSIVDQGNQMAKAGHFDSVSILKSVKDFDKRYVWSPFSIFFLHCMYISLSFSAIICEC